MIQNILRSLGSVEVYGVISVCLFFVVFLVALLFALVQKKSFCKTMSALPLEENERAVKGVSNHEN